MTHRPIAPWALVLLALAALACGLCGCVAPGAVRAAHEFEQTAWANYVRNAGRIAQVQRELYEAERQASIEAATARALERMAATAQLPGTEAAAAAKLIIELRDRSRAETESVLERLNALTDANRREAEIALRAHSLLADYLRSGADPEQLKPHLEQLRALIEGKNKESPHEPEG